MLLIESNYIETVGTEIFMQNDEPRMKWPSEDPNFGNPMGYIYGGKCTADDDCAMLLSYCEESVEGNKILLSSPSYFLDFEINLDRWTPFPSKERFP